MNTIPRFNIEDDDLDLLRRFTAYINRVVTYAQKEYRRQMEHRTHESPLEHLTPKLLNYDDPMPAEKGEFNFADDRIS